MNYRNFAERQNTTLLNCDTEILSVGLELEYEFEQFCGKTLLEVE